MVQKKPQESDNVLSSCISGSLILGDFTEVLFTTMLYNLHNIIHPFVFNITFKRIFKRFRKGADILSNTLSIRIAIN